jgi:hypothetical protein
MKNKLFKLAFPAVMALMSSGIAQAVGIGSGVTITAVQGDCQSTTGGHAHATAFFNRKTMKNIVSTNNEFQSVGGTPSSQDTNLRLDIWKGNYKIVGYNNKASDVVSLPGTCIGHIEVHIPGGTNQSAQFAIEDYLKTPKYGQGVIVRTGQLDVRKKFDIFVDIKKRYGQRQIVWNNFVGMPNPSGEMSMMRFERGQHFSCVNSGETQGTLQFQVFDVDGDFIGVTDGCDSAPKSVHVTPDVTTLDYSDLSGNPVDVSSAIGRGFIKMSGRPNADNGGAASPFTSAVALYATTSTRWPSWNPYWLDKNYKLSKSTITFARRNAGNDTLNLGE